MHLERILSHQNARAWGVRARVCVCMCMYMYVYACVCVRTCELRGVGLQTRPSVRKRQNAWRARGRAAGILRGEYRGRARGGQEETNSRPLTRDTTPPTKTNLYKTKLTNYTVVHLDGQQRGLMMSTERGAGGRCGERNRERSGDRGLRWREGLVCLVNIGHMSMQVCVWCVCVCVCVRIRMCVCMYYTSIRMCVCIYISM